MTSVLHGRLNWAIINDDFELVQSVLNEGAFVNYTNRKGKTHLHIAVEGGNEKIVDILIANGADVNTTAEDFSTPIQTAITSRQFKISEILIRNGAKTNVKLNNGKTLFYTAVQCGEASIVECLLKHGSINKEDNKDCLKLARMSCNIEIQILLLEHNFEIDSECINDSKLFHTIIKKGYVELSSNFLSMGAKINSPVLQDNFHGYTPLHTACKFRQFKIIELLISFNMDLNIKDNHGKMAIYYAVSNCDVESVRLLLINNASIKDDPDLLNVAACAQNIEIVSLLLDYGADINGRDELGRTPLYASVFHQLPQSLQNAPPSDFDELTLVELLSANGASVDAKTESGETAIHEAVRNNNEVIVKTLLKLNADVNVSNSKGTTPLHLAAETGQLRIVKSLLKYRSEVNSVDINGSTPLHLAVRSRDIQIVEILIKSNANINLSNKKGNTCLHISAYGDLEITKLLLNNCADINCVNNNGFTPLLIAARWNPVILGYLMDQGADRNITDFQGRNALYWVVRSSQLNTVVNLLEKHVDVNCKDSEGLTPLLIAINNKNTKLVKILLKYNADVNYTGYKNKSPLHMAVDIEETEIISDLLIHGADVNIINDEGLTALLSAIDSKDYNPADVIELLLEFGADTEFRTNEGKTALYIATERSQVDSVEILLSYGADMSVLYQNKVALMHMYKFITNKKNYWSLESGSGFFGCNDKFYYHVEQSSDIVDVYKDHIRKMVAAHQNVDKNTVRAIKYFNNLKIPKVKAYYDDVHVDDDSSESDSDNESDSEDDDDDSGNSDTDYENKDEDSVESKEVEAMKRERIGTSNITFYNFLTSDLQRVTRYIKNQNVVEVIKGGGYKLIFPTYSGMITARFYGGLERAKLLEKCDYFNHFVHLPFNCIDQIFSYLSNQDLRMMIDAYKSEIVACK